MTPAALPGFIPAPYARALDEYLAPRAPTLLPPVATTLDRLPMQEWRQRLETAAQALNDPLLGLHLGQQLRPEHFGVMGYLFHACGTLGGALARLERYSRLVYDFNPLTVAATAEGLSLRWGTAWGRPGPLVDETAIVGLLTLARHFTGTMVTPLQVQFVNPPPPNLTPYRDVFGCPVTFAAPATEVLLPITELGRPLVAPDSALLASLEAQADAMLAALPQTGLLSMQVRQRIAHALPHGCPSQDAIARQLHRSARSLHRDLAAEGTRFRDILAQTRQDLALAYLEDPQMRIVDVALLCGFADQSAFTRAFRQWTGHAPATIRKTAQAMASRR